MATQTLKRSTVTPRIRMPHARPSHSAARDVLGRYTDASGNQRELVMRYCQPKNGAPSLRVVIDRLSATIDDRRLVACLFPEEPDSNAELVAMQYRWDLDRTCRRFTADPDAYVALASEEAEPPSDVNFGADGGMVCPEGFRYRLLPLATRTPVPELRWFRTPTDGEGPGHPVTLRCVCAAFQDYRPFREVTIQAVALHRKQQKLAVGKLREEWVRLVNSHIVLNRGLREAVQARLAGDTSSSEIAMRCGRLKTDPRGNISGETSWLVRRIGVIPEGGQLRPTPWVHSEVLALIARRGLGLEPYHVEVA